MKNPIKALLERDERRWQTRGVKDWERRRVEGKWMFVFKFGFLWGLMMIAAFTLMEYVFDGRIKVENLWFKGLLFPGVGLFVGLFMWHEGERKYQKHLEGEAEEKNGRFSRR